VTPSGALYSGLLGDAEIGALFSDAAEIAEMIAVERALARAEAAVGIVPAEAAAAIDSGLAGVTVAPQALAEGVAADGIPVPALVAALRKALPPEAGHWLHWGATSQDVMDCALVLRLLRALDAMETRLAAIIAALADMAERWADAPVAARTRTRIATPIAFGLRVGQWLHPLLDLRDRAAGLRARLARVQFGGASGAATAVAPHGPAVADALAKELNLATSPPWHANRAAFAELAGWCADLAGALAKPAGDLILMNRNEAGEVRLCGGGSSTMPNKANPVAAETVLALARHAAALAAPLHAAAAHAEERDGAAWTLEWLTLPPLVVSAAAALRHAATLVETVEPRPEAMARTLALDGGAALAEAASFALAAHMPRAEAQALVKAAVKRADAEGRALTDVLAEATDAPVNWATALDPAAAAAPSRAILDRILERARA